MNRCLSVGLLPYLLASVSDIDGAGSLTAFSHRVRCLVGEASNVFCSERIAPNKSVNRTFYSGPTSSGFAIFASGRATVKRRLPKR